jgi:hypothetical protein
MDTRDWELLDKQFQTPQPAPPPNGVVVLMLMGIFILGLTTGAVLAPGSTPLPTAGDGTAALVFSQHGAGHEMP